MRRCLLLVLPNGFHRIRHYGLLANARRKNNIAAARALLDAPASLSPVDPKTATASSISPRSTFVCRHCGAPMLIRDFRTRTVHSWSTRLQRSPE